MERIYRTNKTFLMTDFIMLIGFLLIVSKVDKRV